MRLALLLLTVLASCAAPPPAPCAHPPPACGVALERDDRPAEHFPFCVEACPATRRSDWHRVVR